MLVFHTTSVLAAACCPEPPGPARRELLRPQREARRLVTADGGVEFHELRNAEDLLFERVQTTSAPGRWTTQG